MNQTFPITKIDRREIGPDLAPNILQFHEIWQDWCGDRWAPCWKDVDMMAIPTHMVRYVVVCDVMPGDDFYYRFWGSGHSAYHNADYSRKNLSDMTHLWTIEALRSQYLEVVETKTPWQFQSTYDSIANPVPSYRAPLSDDGKVVTGLICYVPRQDVETELRAWHYDPKL